MTKDTDIFETRAPLLIRDVRRDDRIVDVVVGDDGLIAAIGEKAGRGHEYDHEIDGRGRVLLPGLVNTHTHAAMTLLRGTRTTCSSNPGSPSESGRSRPT